MLAMMIYVVIIGVLLSVAALVAEHAAKQRGGSRRWLWLGTIIASLLLPLIMSSVTFQVPELLQSTTDSKPIVLRDTTSVQLPLAVLDLGMPADQAQPHHLDTLLHRLWLGTSLLMLALLLLSGTLLYRRKRHWAAAGLCQTRVLVAPDIGPAVVGLLRPCIVVPEWLLHESPARQQLVIAHEQSHLEARDPQLLTFALCLLVAMPWNLPLWWQLHRLRRAIEVDCDARVLRGGHSVAGYCDTLIQVGQNQSRYIGAVAAMSESGSFLEQRIKIMLLKPGKWARLTALAMIGASVGMAAFAAQVTPPDSPSATGDQQVTVSPGVLASYTGAYQFGPYTLMTVKPEGSHLSTQLTGQISVPVYPSSNTEFFAKMVKASISFEQDAQGQTTSLVLHQDGNNTTAPRIDAVKAQEISQALDARYKAQQPFPGSEQALQIVLDHDPNSPRFSPQLAKAMREQMASFLAVYVDPLGPVTSHEFIGVTPQGWDKYLVRHEHGTEIVVFVLDANGIIVGSYHRLS
jgi:bla regulator protein blaR1